MSMYNSTYSRSFSRLFLVGFMASILILFSGFSLKAYSIEVQERQQVTAVIRDAGSSMPIPNASASLLHPVTGAQIRSSQSSQNGSVHLQDIAPGAYHLRITFVGYSDYLREDIQVVAGEDLNLGNIRIEEAGEVIAEIVVQAETPAIQLGIDRKIFNVAESMVSVGGSASDLLTNVPSLEVDMDGSVSLRGSSSVKILIDGKESAMAGSDIGSLLQSMPASSIERVEVVTNPSSRYDAEGQSGIINIVLKKNQRTGLNGAINTSVGSYENVGAGVNLNYRDRRFNYYGSYNFNRRNSVGDGMNSTRLLSTNSLTNNVSESNRLGLNNSIKLGVDHYLTEKTTIGVSGDLSIRTNERSEDIFYSYLNHPSLSGSSERLSNQIENDLGYDVNLDFKHEFAPQHELVANFRYGQDSEEGVNTFNQDFQSTMDNEHRINDGTEYGRNYNIQVDYFKPFGENNMLEVGYRTRIRMSDDHQFSRVGFNGLTPVPDYAVSNDFEMRNTVHAIYANYQRKITEKLGLQFGLRAEQAYLNTSFGSLDPEVPAGDREVDGSLDYFRVYPSIFLTQEFGEGNQLQGSYTRRVSRPRGWQVNPFVDMSDPLNIRQGNPDLMPEDIHSFEVSYAKQFRGLTLTSSVYHRRMNDVVQSIISVVDESSGATFSQFQNISRNETSGFEFISRFDITKFLDLMANVNAFYTSYEGSEAFGIASTDGFSWNANATVNFRILPNLSGQTRFDYRAPRIMAQGKSVENYVVDAGLRLDVLQRRASIMFNVRDLFNQRRWGGYTQTQNVYREYESRWMRRMFTVSLSYRFGMQDNQRRDENRRDDMDDFGGGEPQF